MSIKLILVKIFIALILIFNAGAAENKILFKIENEIITTIDINNEYKYLLSLNPKIINLEDNKIFEISKNSIIREMIKRIEILKNIKEIKVDEKILETVIRKRYQQLGFDNVEDFIAKISIQGITMKNIEDKITIEILWNQLIYTKFASKIKINKKNLKDSLLDKSKIRQKSYLIYEIIFGVKSGSNLENEYEKIKKSISDIGFQNTATLYSVSDSAKIGGKIGWIKENSLNSEIKNKINKIDIGNFSKPIVIPGGFLILKIKDQKIIEKKINLTKELQDLIKIKQNEQLNQFSNIYFNKIKKNIQINEL